MVPLFEENENLNFDIFKRLHFNSDIDHLNYNVHALLWDG